MTKFNELITQSKTPVLVDFHALWCGPCKMMGPTLKELAHDLKGQVRILKVDIDKNPDAAKKFQIRGVPTLILFHKGKILWRQSGVIPKHEIAKAILAHS